MRLRWTLSIPAVVFALMLLMVGSSYASAQVADSAHINKLLTDAEHYANQAARDSEELETYTRTRAGWETHAAQLERIRGHVNNLGKVVQQLNEARPEGSPWQKTAIDRITPLMHEIAMQLTTTIQHLSENQSRIQMKPYQDYVRATYEVNSRAARIITDYVQYGKATSNADKMEQSLELPASGASK